VSLCRVPHTRTTYSLSFIERGKINTLILCHNYSQQVITGVKNKLIGFLSALIGKHL